MDKKLMKLFLECPNVVREVVLSDMQIALVKHIKGSDYGWIEAKQLAEMEGCSIQNASTRLAVLCRKKYLTRVGFAAKSGGTEYRYSCAFDFKVQA